MSGRTETHIFRATMESWLGQFLLPFLFFGLIIITFVNSVGINPGWGGLALLGLLTVGVFEFALPMLLSWLQLGPMELSGSMSGKRFHIYWSDVLAAWMLQRGRRAFLCLGTQQGTAIIPLRFFDAQAVWKGVSERVAPAALESSAFQRLPGYQDWAAVRDNIISQDAPARKVVDHWLIQIIGWGSLSFFVTSAAGSWLSGHPEFILLFAFLGLLAASIIAEWGITEFDHTGVKRQTLMGTWCIAWDELEQVEIDPLGARIILKGAKKWVAISGPSLWVGLNREEALTFLQAQAEHRHVPLLRSIWALFKFSRNSRSKRP